MKNFLKKYSDVPNGFIDDFFNIAKEEYNDTELSIDFDMVCKWLNVRKDNLKLPLTKFFSENYDYSITEVNKKHVNSSGASHAEIIMITPDCFKELCMISQTDKAKEVRKYYLSVEKLIRKYHQHIQEKLQNKIQLLNTNQAPKINIKGGVIYFFRALNQINSTNIDDILYKIGKTYNTKNRFNTYNSGNANDIEPLFILECNDINKVEKCIKNLLTEYQYRKHKEIYEIGVDALKLVFFQCDELVQGFKKYMESNKNNIVDTNFKKLRKSKNGIFLSLKKNKN